LFTDLGCIHTQWSHAAEYLDYRNKNIALFPLDIMIRGNRFYVRENYSSDESLMPGTEILKLDGESVKQYLEKNYALLPVDGKNKTTQQRWLETYFPQHHSNFWAHNDTFRLELRFEGKRFSKKVAACSQEDLKNKRSEKSQDKKRLPFYVHGHTAVLQVPSLVKNGRFEHFTDSCFSVIQSRKIKSLVLDLRGLGADDPRASALLYAYVAHQPFRFAGEAHLRGDSSFVYSDPALSFDTVLKQTMSLTHIHPVKPNAFAGDLFILTDGGISGAKAHFCVLAAERPGTYFAGEARVSSQLDMNTFPVRLTLPNTGIRVDIPTVQIIAFNKSYRSKVRPVLHYPYTEREPGKLLSYAIDLAERNQNPQK
jgi:hypothetical protein